MGAVRFVHSFLFTWGSRFPYFYHIFKVVNASDYPMSVGAKARANAAKYRVPKGHVIFRRAKHSTFFVFPGLSTYRVMSRGARSRPAFKAIIRGVRDRLLANSAQYYSRVRRRKFRSLSRFGDGYPRNQIVRSVPRPRLHHVFAQLGHQSQRLRSANPVFTEWRFMVAIRIVTRSNQFICCRRRVVPSATSHSVRSTLVPWLDSGVKDHIRLTTVCGYHVVRMGNASFQASHVNFHHIKDSSSGRVIRVALYLVTAFHVSNVRVRFPLRVEVKGVLQGHGDGTRLSITRKIVPCGGHVQVINRNRDQAIVFVTILRTNSDRLTIFCHQISCADGVDCRLPKDVRRLSFSDSLFRDFGEC